MDCHLPDQCALCRAAAVDLDPVVVRLRLKLLELDRHSAARLRTDAASITIYRP